MQDHADVVVIGGGNAGFSAAHAAAERGRQVLLLEKGEPEQAGGNSYFTAGAVRIAHDGFGDVAGLLDADDRHAVTVLPPYPAAAFTADMAKVTSGRNDPALTEVLVAESLPTLRWLHEKGLRYRLMYERQAYPDAEGRHVFWGGLAVGSTGAARGSSSSTPRPRRRPGWRSATASAPSTSSATAPPSPGSPGATPRAGRAR